jgi:ferritin-like metal-binding protein YciE
LLLLGKQTVLEVSDLTVRINPRLVPKHKERAIMRLDSLHTLYIEELQDLYSAETQLVEALPKMANAASDATLKQGFHLHLEQTQGHVQRLESILDRHGEKYMEEPCKGMQGLIEEGAKMIRRRGADPDAQDAGLIAAAQRVEHYEIAGYGTVCAYAKQMGYQEDLALLVQSLEEERLTDETLTTLAEEHINQRAA